MGGEKERVMKSLGQENRMGDLQEKGRNPGEQQRLGMNETKRNDMFAEVMLKPSN